MMKFDVQLALAMPALFAPTLALAQAVEQTRDQTVPTDTALPSLMFFTFGIALVIGLGLLALLLRKRSNRAALDRTLNPNHPSNK